MSSQALRCWTCGAATTGKAIQCTYCTAPLDGHGCKPVTPLRSVAEASTAWGRTIFGAPRHLGRLVTSVEVRDEIVERLFTTVVRREVREERAPGPAGRQTPPPIDAWSVDPFSVSPEQLRISSQHVTGCSVCTGSGTRICPSCRGGGRAQCGNCHGSGQERRYYKKSSRLVKCTVCRGGGTVACGGCGARGRTACEACSATGNQLAWLTYYQTTRTMLFVTDSPIVRAHSHLTQEQNLVSSDLVGFSVVVTSQAQSALSEAEGVPASLLQTHLRAVDPRLERIATQQYTKLAVLRRDANFEMCGTRGTLVLSGNNLLGSTTPDALHPIRRRQILWVMLWTAMLVGSVVFLGAATHDHAYFVPTNRWLFALTLIALTASIPALGIALREWRKNFLVKRLALYEKALVAASIVPAVLAVAITAIAMPRVSEAATALAANDVARARIVLDALLTTRDGEPDVLAARDDVELAEASKLSGNAKLKLLDQVAARKGSRANDATRIARGVRLSSITSSLNAGLPVAALENLDRWFGHQSSTDHEVAELRARAEDLLFASCSEEQCRFASALRASRAAPSTARTARFEESKAALLSSLKFAPVANEAVPDRLKRLRLLADAATAARNVATGDQDVLVAAEQAIAFAAAERSHVAIIGAHEAAVAELLGPLTSTSKLISKTGDDVVSIFVVFDSQRRCRGLYAVGSQPKSRAIARSIATKLLSQSVGRSIELKSPARPDTPSRWIEGGVPIVARWEGTGPVELRIGDAAP